MSYLGGVASGPAGPADQTHAAPPAGYPVDPIALVSGTVAEIPVPVQQGGPVPIPLHWCIVQNNSPYTLLVSQGTPLKQIAPFTADEVEVLDVNGRTPITLLPQAGSGTIAPGSDSIANATWYGPERPAGSYPASLGSGSVALINDADLIDLLNAFVAHGDVNTYGPFPTQGFQGLSIAASNTGQAPLEVQLGWTYLDGSAAGNRRFVLGDTFDPIIAGASMALQIPHMGPLLSISIVNVNAVDGGITLHAQQTSLPVSQWSGRDNRHVVQVIPAGTTVTVITVDTLYAGPAYIDLTWGGTLFTINLIGIDRNGATFFVGAWGNSSDPVRIRENMLVPAFPLYLQVTNNDGANHSVTASITYDLSRTGG